MNFANSSWKLYASKSVGRFARLATWLSSIEVARTTIRRCLRRSGHQSSGTRCLRQAAIKRVSDSFCYRRSLDESKAEAIWKSTGRFASAPRASDGILTISPRVRNDEGVYYGMTAIDLTDGNNTKRAQLVLPSSVSRLSRPYIWAIPSCFLSRRPIVAWGSLGNMGTYIGNEGWAVPLPVARAARMCGWQEEVNTLLRYRRRIS